MTFPSSTKDRARARKGGRGPSDSDVRYAVVFRAALVNGGHWGYFDEQVPDGPSVEPFASEADAVTEAEANGFVVTEVVR